MVFEFHLIKREVSLAQRNKFPGKKYPILYRGANRLELFFRLGVINEKEAPGCTTGHLLI
jgi:hypothetical protein